MTTRTPHILAVALRLLLFLYTATEAQASTPAPNWISIVTNKPASFDYGNAHIAILLDEDTLEINTDGSIKHRERFIQHILTQEGIKTAVAKLYYKTSSCKIQSFNAWLIRKKRPLLTYGKKDRIDLSAAGDFDLYSESRVQKISAVNDAEIGTTFAYEFIYTENSVFSQERWYFSSKYPTERSRITIQLAEGWNADAFTFNHAPITPIVSANKITWELTQIPAYRTEPMSPGSSTTQPWIGINLIPPANAKKITRIPLFTWGDIASYFNPIYTAKAQADAAITAKATDLCKESTTTLDRIRTLCDYVQKTQYVSILLDANMGGGYIPHTASEIFRCNYGDCKDKATLLRAMLATQNIESIPLLVFSGDPLHVQASWPSTGNFNHCILAIKADASVPDSTAVITHPIYGRLIIFDPTNPYCPVGFLPEEDSGGLGLLLTQQETNLIRLPQTEPLSKQHSIVAEIQSDGSLAGTAEQCFSGSTAATERARLRLTTPTDLHKTLSAKFQAVMPLSKVTKPETADDTTANTVKLTTTFTAENVGKPLSNGLLIFNPIIFPWHNDYPVLHGKRTQPILIPPVDYSESIQINLPENISIEELPKNVSLKSSIGTYTASLRKEGDRAFRLERALKLYNACLPASDVKAVRAFQEQVTEAEQSPVVLRWKKS